MIHCQIQFWKESKDTWYHDHIMVEMFCNSPHKAAQRISELKRFLYFRISGVSLSMTVGATFTLICEPLLAYKKHSISSLISSTDWSVHLSVTAEHTTDKMTNQTRFVDLYLQGLSRVTTHAWLVAEFMHDCPCMTGHTWGIHAWEISTYFTTVFEQNFEHTQHHALLHKGLFCERPKSMKTKMNIK